MNPQSGTPRVPAGTPRALAALDQTLGLTEPTHRPATSDQAGGRAAGHTGPVVGAGVEGPSVAVGLGPADYAELTRRRGSLREFARRADDAAAAAGVTPAQQRLLVIVAGAGRLGPRIRDVADALWVAHHTAVELVDRTEAAGLVRREEDPRDRRVVRVALTARGRAVLEALAPAHRRELVELPRLLSWAGEACR